MSTNSSDKNDSGNGDRIRLRVLGISYSQIQSGAYALILAQVDGPYRIPVVVGSSEAQSIAIKMEGIIPPRPMTHDLFASLAHAYGLELKEVFIHKFEEGIFSSDLIFENSEGKEIVLDARTSDAIAIAMRTNSPIWTTPEILEETGFIMEIKETDPHLPSDEEIERSLRETNLEELSLEELQERLNKHIAQEEYEQAAKIKAIIARRAQDSEQQS